MLLSCCCSSMLRSTFVFLLPFLLLFFISAEGGLNSLADCNAVASSFRNTCSGGPAASVASMSGETISCTGQPTCLTSGGVSGNTCTWNRKLCVTCRSSSGITYIRVQTNSLPDHCFYSSSFTVRELAVDFEVKFNLDVTVGAQGYPSPRSGKTWPTTQTDVTNTVCGDPLLLTPNSDAQTLSGLTFTSGSQEMGTAVGVGLNGVLLLNQMSGEKSDPFYPKAWSGAPTVSSVAETIDVCLGHPTPDPANIYHYHDMSPCQADNTLRTATAGASCDSDVSCAGHIKDFGLAAYTNNASWVNSLRVAGIAKDGRIIYGPYQSSGLIVNFDVCNGAWLDANGDSTAETYAYIYTKTFPYFAGCFGPGNYPSYVPECTTNPPQGYYVPGSTPPPTTTSAATTSSTSTTLPPMMTTTKPAGGPTTKPSGPGPTTTQAGGTSPQATATTLPPGTGQTTTPAAGGSTSPSSQTPTPTPSSSQSSSASQAASRVILLGMCLCVFVVMWF